MSKTLFAQTFQLAFRIAVAWAGGFLFAVAVRAILPDGAGFTLTSPRSTHFIAYNRVGFWTCLLAALAVSAMVVIRTMLADLGLWALHK